MGETSFRDIEALIVEKKIDIKIIIDRDLRGFAAAISLDEGTLGKHPKIEANKEFIEAISRNQLAKIAMEWIRRDSD